MISVVCTSEPHHVHEYPDDWVFAGADGTHPGGDARYEPSNYVYMNERLETIWTTSVPICDDQAIDYFTQVAAMGPQFNPVYLRKREPNGTYKIIPFIYDRETDEAKELVAP